MISPCIQWAPIAEVGGGGRPRGRGLYVYLGLGALASESGKHLRGEDGGACLESRVTTRYNVMCFGIKQPQPWRTPQQNGRRPQCLPELVFGSVLPTAVSSAESRSLRITRISVLAKPSASREPLSRGLQGKNFPCCVPLAKILLTR